MSMSAEKRKRNANYTQKEKLRFLRIMQERGQIIVTKVGTHDGKTNRIKEESWTDITDTLNSFGGVLRTSDNLKKLWQKMKTEVKLFRALRIKNPEAAAAKALEDPVLKFADEVIGEYCCIPTERELARCDQDNITWSADDSHGENTRDMSANPTPKNSEDGANVESFNVEITSTAVKTENYLSDGLESENENDHTSVMTDFSRDDSVPPPPSVEPYHASLKRKRSLATNIEDNYTISPSTQLYNTLIIARLHTEKQKEELVKEKKQNEMDMHMLRMENERRMYALKEAILKEILGKLQDGKHIDPEILKLALNGTSDS